MSVHRHVVMFSGGASSWATAKRVVQAHGTEGVVLLFADTMMEDEDLYRFLYQAAANVGAPLVRIADGRTPWEVFRDTRMIGNSRVDPCSRILKRELLNKWRDTNCDPTQTTIYLGISWDEIHRIERVRANVAPWKYEAPMCDPPYLGKRDMLEWLKREGIEPPRLYAMGFPHNNCGGFCIKAGQAQFALLMRMMPERYAAHEAREEEMRQYLGKDVSVLRDRRGGESKPMTLAAFRERVERGEFDRHEWGGCGCAIDDGQLDLFQEAERLMKERLA